jgi:hypothetical protein
MWVSGHIAVWIKQYKLGASIQMLAPAPSRSQLPGWELFRSLGEFCRRQFLADYTINMFGSDFRQGQVHHWNLLLDLDQFAALKPAAMRSWHRCSNSCP